MPPSRAGRVARRGIGKPLMRAGCGRRDELMGHRKMRPDRVRPILVKCPEGPVEAVVEADALDAALDMDSVLARVPLSGVVSQDAGEAPRWRVVVAVQDGCPQPARDGLNSLLWFRAKDEAQNPAERRALLAAVTRLESERVDDLTVLGTPLPDGAPRSTQGWGATASGNPGPPTPNPRPQLGPRRPGREHRRRPGPGPRSTHRTRPGSGTAGTARSRLRRGPLPRGRARGLPAGADDPPGRPFYLLRRQGTGPSVSQILKPVPMGAHAVRLVRHARNPAVPAPAGPEPPVRFGASALRPPLGHGARPTAQLTLRRLSRR